MKKIFITLSILLLTICVKAQTFTDGNLKYEVTSNTDLTVEMIGIDMADLTKLTKLTIPNTVTYGSKTYYVTSIREGACPESDDVVNLKSISVGDYVEKLPTRCFNYYPITSIHLGNNIKTIGYGALSYCRNMESINLPANLIIIEMAAFMSTPLGSSLTVPNGVKNITYAVFDNTKVENITFLGQIESFWTRALRTKSLLTIDLSKTTTPPSFVYQGNGDLDNTFDDYAYDAVYVKVPEGCVDVYRKDKNWGMFKHIVDGPITTRACEPVKITFEDGKYNFYCATPGVQFHSKVETLGASTGEFTSNSVPSSPSFVKVSVYASKDGFDDSKTTVMTFRNDGTVISADVNTDGSINAADVVSVYNYIIDGE